MTTLTLQTDRTLIRSSARSTRYVLATIHAPVAPKAVERAPLDLAFVIDRSGSMQGEKIHLAREAVLEGIGMLRDTDRFTVVSFDDMVDVVVPLTAATREARQAAGDHDGWLLGHGWSIDKLGDWPDAGMLESVAPGRPIALYAHDHHSRWISPTAISRAGIDSASGDLVRRDEAGSPTGILHEGGSSLVDSAIPDPSHGELVDGLRAVAARLDGRGKLGTLSEPLQFCLPFAG